MGQNFEARNECLYLTDKVVIRVLFYLALMKY